MGMTNENNVELIDRNKLLDVIDGDLRIGADDSWMWDKIVNAPTVEAIPKADYEARLRADMVAMLEELDLQIDESAAYNLEVAKVQRLIRDKINALEGEKE